MSVARPEGSMKLLTVRHATTYRYSAPVTFGQHRLMLRPRDSHDLRLVGAELALSPPGTVRWMHDVFGNSVALVDFADACRRAVHRLDLDDRALRAARGPTSRSRRRRRAIRSCIRPTTAPISARLRERALSRTRAATVEEWARQFILETPTNTFNLLATMNAAIRGSFEYRAREEEGTQAPLETIERKSGTCRDYRAAVHRGGAHARLRRALRLRLSLRSGARRRRRRCRARARRTPGPTSICRAPAGSSSIRPTGWSRART